MKAAEMILSSFNYFVDKFASFVHNYRIEDTIVIVGSPRSGSTWLMELLEAIPGYKSVFEPFHPKWYPEFGRNGFPYTPYVPDETELAWLGDYLERVFSGNVHARFPYRRPVVSRLKASKLVVKFVRANTILPWVSESFGVRALYFILRHPCATIASQLATGYYSRITPKQLAVEIEKIEEIGGLSKRVSSLSSEITRLAAVWAFENYIPLSSESKRWYTVVYERLVTDPDSELGAIFGYIGENVPEPAWKRVGKPSMVTKKSYGKEYIGTPRQLLKWREKLSERQVREILNVISWFGLEFYGDEPEPYYDVLKEWGVTLG